MIFQKKQNTSRSSGLSIFHKYVRFRYSIYGRVVFIISLLSLILFASFGLIFRSVNIQYLNTVMRQNGNNIGSIVESALYQSMLDNDKTALQNSMNIINTMSGIDDVNMYNSKDSLVYSSISSNKSSHSDPNCLSCHTDLKSMFPTNIKSYRILNMDSKCSMNQNDNQHRHLIIKSPIKNDISCYTSACHAHKSTDVILGSLIIKMPLNELDDAVNKSTTDFLLLATLTTLLLGFSLIWFTGKKIKKPLNDIIKASQAVASGDTNTRLPLKTRQLDDIRMVSFAFNNMLDNLNAAAIELQNWSMQLEYKVQKKSEELMDAQNELVQVERIASLGKLSSSVAHEINNPLSGILTYSKLVQKQLNKVEMDSTNKESMLKHLKVIESETKRCGEIVKGLLEFSKKDQQNFEYINLHKILLETFDLMAHQMKMSNINFISDFSAGTDLTYCSPNQIKQACVAVLVNASEAINENGEIIFRTINPDKDSIAIQVIDNGFGISSEDMPHIFEPFFSAKPKVSGIGLGLAIVHGIVQSHKGKIEVNSLLGKGTTITIFLPLNKSS